MQLSEQDMAAIQGVTDQHFGTKPEAPPAPKETPNEKVQAANGPQTEADKSAAEPVTFDITFGDNDKRQITEKQIKSTFERYRDLNHKHSSAKPLLDLAERVMTNAKKDGKEVGHKDVADFLEAAAKAYAEQKAPAEQKQEKQEKPQSKDFSEVQAQLDKWAKDNAVDLPPGYADSYAAINQMRSENAELKAMLQQVIQGQQGVTQAAQKQLQGAEGQHAQAIQKQIGNNLAKAQSALQLPDEAEQDFMSFAFDRGYTIEDFVDPGLTMKIAQDFKNLSNSSELDRLRGLTQRRQAYTGTVEGSPGVSGETPKASPDQSFIDQVTASHFANRGR